MNTGLEADTENMLIGYTDLDCLVISIYLELRIEE